MKGLVACEATLQSRVEQARRGRVYFALGAEVRSEVARARRAAVWESCIGMDAEAEFTMDKARQGDVVDNISHEFAMYMRDYSTQDIWFPK